MPITQDRLLRLITAGEHFRDTAAALRAMLNSKSAQLFAHTITFEQAIAELGFELNAAVPYDAQAASILSEERTRYNITHKRNSIEKRRIYNRRHGGHGGQEAPRSPTTPKLTPTEVLAQVNSRFPGTDLDDDLPTISPTIESVEPTEKELAEWAAWKATQPPKEDQS